MLINLIDNAIKFNRRGGSVTISASGSDERTSILVTDTGEGILPDLVRRVGDRRRSLGQGRRRCRRDGGRQQRQDGEDGSHVAESRLDRR